MAFFTLRSSHTLFLLILGAMVIPIIVNQYYPQYLTYSGYAAIGIIITLILGLYLNAIIQGPRYPHIEHTIYDSVTGIAYAIKDFFIDREPEAGAAIPEVYSIMKKDVNGKDEPRYLFGKWWYPYLVKTHWSVDFGDYKNAFLHIFVLPHPWKDFLGFGRRPEAAYLTGEQIDHGSSTHLDSILAPFKVDYFGIEIPVYLGILSIYTIGRITQGWEEGMKELARMLVNMNDLIAAQAENIFPQKELEEMVEHVFPNIKIPSQRNKRKT